MSLEDNFFTELGNDKPYIKAAFEGFAGAGKTHTAALLLIGLYKRIGSNKPVIIFDTEKASGFLKKLFADAAIKVLVKQSRSLADLKEVMNRMRDGLSDFLLLDSVTHIWENFTESYKKKAKRTRLEFHDWGIIKPAWKEEFSDHFVCDPYHAIMTGRAGYEYENEINEDTGKREIFKSGIKMKVEGDTAFEPDLLVLMNRMQEMRGNTVERVYRQATIIKDRSTLIDGKIIENPSYEDFVPFVEFILENPTERHVGPAERDAAELLKTEEDKFKWKQEKKKWLEEIENYLVSVWPGQSAADKKNKVDALEYAFKTRSWTAIEALSPSVLEQGYKFVQEFAKTKIRGSNT